MALDIVGAIDQQQETNRANPQVVTCSTVPNKDPT